MANGHHNIVTGGKNEWDTNYGLCLNAITFMARSSVQSLPPPGKRVGEIFVCMRTAGPTRKDGSPETTSNEGNNHKV